MLVLFDQIIKEVLIDEGGYVNDVNDSGGETKYGISKRAFPQLNIKKLTIDAAKEIYRIHYWEKCKAQELPPELRYIHFDTAVNMGIYQAGKILQRSIGDVGVDGIVGRETISNAYKSNVYLYGLERCKVYAVIVQQNPKNSRFMKGWINRVVRIIRKTK